MLGPNCRPRATTTNPEILPIPNMSAFSSNRKNRLVGLICVKAGSTMKWHSLHIQMTEVNGYVADPFTFVADDLFGANFDTGRKRLRRGAEFAYANCARSHH